MLERGLIAMRCDLSLIPPSRDTTEYRRDSRTKTLMMQKEMQRAARLVRGSSGLALLEHVELLRARNQRTAKLEPEQDKRLT